MYVGNILKINSKYIMPPPNINIFPLLTSNNFLFFNQQNPLNYFNSKSFLPKILVILQPRRECMFVRIRNLREDSD